MATDSTNGTLPTFTVGDKTYHVRAFRPLTDYRQIEARMRTVPRQNPIDLILPELTKLAAFPDLQKEMLKDAYRDLKADPQTRLLSREEVAAWLNTVDGIIYTLYLLLKDNHPEISEEEVRTLLDDLGEEQLKKRLDEAFTAGNPELAAKLQADAVEA